MTEKNNMYYVYRIINNDWGVPFYIGKGSNGRYKDYNNRPIQIKKILEQYNCASEILIDNMTESNALIMEKYIKQAYKEMGYPIIDYERYGDASAQRCGIDIAKAKGKHLGRPKAIKPDNWGEVINRWENGEITAKKAIELTGMKRSTFYQLVKDG